MIYKSVVYSLENPQGWHLWCEYRVRVHALSKNQYQVEAYEAEDELTPSERLFRKGRKLVQGDWSQSPKAARNDVEEELDMTFLKQNFVYENCVKVPLRISEEEF